MNILVIGNGFDLAHRLPTKYTDFLKWIVDQVHFYDYLSQQQDEIVQNIPRPKLLIPQSKKRERRSHRVSHQQEIWKCINDNFWLEYFLQCDMHGEENWIDFESEISQIIQSLDADINSPKEQCFTLEDKIQRIRNEYMNRKYIDWFAKKTYKELRNKLLEDLNKLIRALEIYLTEYVEKIDCNLVSPDIQEIFSKRIARVNNLPVYDTYVLSFNYTNTYQNVYLEKIHQNEYFEKYIDYIHGEAKIENTVALNKMVLGIDEYLTDDRKDKDIEFIAFKKYYQRIYKGTGCKYKEWVDRIKESWDNETVEGKAEIRKQISIGNVKNNKIHNLYIFGHSLDVTDKDILRDLILNDNVYTTIFIMIKVQWDSRLQILLRSLDKMN